MPCTCGLNAAQMTSKELLSLKPADYVETVTVRETYYDSWYGHLQDEVPVYEMDGRCDECQSICNSAESGYWDFDNQIIAEAVALSLDTWGGMA